MPNLNPKTKVWITSSDVDGVFGDGKFRLLQAIDQEGSLQAASKELGISYRKAWGDLKKAEDCLGISLVERSRGGTKGGKTALTAAGIKVVKAYAELRQQVDCSVKNNFDDFIAAIKNEN